MLFLVSSPLVILYAFGFRYDFNEKKIIQTGIIYLTPNIQDNIKILINSKEELNKINIKGIFKKEFVLYNLMPKIYNIRIEKENYHTWEKNLAVLPGLITYAQPLLLPSSPITNLIFKDSNILLWSISDKFKKIYYLKNENGKISANVYDFLSKSLNTKSIGIPRDLLKNKNIIPADSKIYIAPDGKNFAIIFPEDPSKIILLDSNEKDLSITANLASSDKIIDGQWDNSSRYFLYLNEKGDLNQFDLITVKSSKIIEKILGFTMKNEEIYYLDRNNLFIYQSSINNPHEKQQLSFLPLPITSGKQTPETTDKTNIIKKITLATSAENALALITPEKNLFIIGQNGIPIGLGNNVESATFSKDGENIVFNSSFEIFTRTLSGSQENLVTRVSQKISNVSWFSDYNHIWFLANQIIKNIELDSRPTPNIIDFISLPKEPSSILYTDANFMYYDQQNNDNTLSLYQVQIQN